MYYSIAGKKFINTENFHKLDYQNYQVYYTGLIYLRTGIKAGKPSVDRIVQEYEAGKIQFRNIYGSYVIVMEDKRDGHICMFSDNSSMSTMFYTDAYIGDNFVEMAKSISYCKLEPRIICEYLTLSRGYYFETFIKEIQMLKAACYYELREGKLSVWSKKLGDLGESSQIADIPSFFADMAKSLSGCKVITALTGGYDSRMVVSCLKDRLDMDLFLSGNNEESQEIRCAREAASSIQKELKLLSPDMKTVDKEAILERNFEESGGRACYNTSGLYRVHDFQDKLQKQGYEVLLTGEAGDMYKDFWYKQDYPFYYKKHTNAGLFYSTRMESVNNSKFIGKLLMDDYKQQKKRIVFELDRMKCDRAARSYDKYGFVIDWEKTVFSHLSGTQMICYAPLQELELVKYAFLQPVRQKYFNRLQRQVISGQAPELAKVPTVYGTNASIDGWSVFHDSFVETFGQFKRLIRAIKRKLGDREKSMAKVMLEDDSDMRELPLSRRALEYCKQKDYIDSKITMQEMPVTLLYRVIYLYQLEQEISKK